MTTAVVSFEKKNLSQIFEESKLSNAQVSYLSLWLRGLQPCLARDVTGVKYNTIIKWDGDETFKAVEKYLDDHSSEYKEQALTMFVGTLSAKAQELLDSLIDKGINKWDTLDKTDKQCIMQALSIIQKRERGKDSSPGSYEELILRRKISNA